MSQNLVFLIDLLAASRNRNLPESRLMSQYVMRFARSGFPAYGVAVEELINAGIVERIPPLHVRLI
jgi:hypothetical protein